MNFRRLLLLAIAPVVLVSCSEKKDPTGVIAGPPVAIAVNAGDGQSAPAGTVVPTALRVRVTDADGVGVPSVGVTWQVTAGGGSLASGTTMTNNSGVAIAPAWTLGKTVSAQGVSATAGTFIANFTATIQTTYQLEVRWLGTAPVGPTLDAFTRAVNRLRATVTGGTTAVQLPPTFTNVSQCDPALVGYPDIPQETIQGLVIYAVIDSIDGPAQVLGSAGPCLVRSTNNSKPALGIMRFDSADVANQVANNRWDSVILHEMLHVVGIGTIWVDNNLLKDANTANSRFTGARARTACATTHGGTATCAVDVPVHSTDGVGSRDSHWRETTFTNELMTPFISAGASPMSEMTIESLGDMGYVVNRFTADAFLLAVALMDASAMGGPAPLAMPAPRRPRFSITPQGALVPIPPRIQ